MKYLNQSHLQHSIYALAMLCIVGVFFGYIAGASFAIAFFLAREHTQAEYKYIKDNGGDRYRTPKLPELGCLSSKYWSIDSILDFTIPSILVIVITIILI